MAKVRCFIVVLAIVVTIFLGCSVSSKMEAMDWGHVTISEATERFKNLHATYDRKFKTDSNWSTASKGNFNIYELNFARWLLKNGHASELVHEEDFSKTASSYEAMITTWNRLTSNGSFSNYSSASTYKKYSAGNNRVTDLKPVTWDSNLQSYVNQEATYANRITKTQDDNRVNFGIHEPSKQIDEIRRASGNDAQYTEVLYSGSSDTVVKPTIEQFILGYLIDDDNALPNEEGGHRWVLLSGNKYVASAFTRVKGNIINFSPFKVNINNAQRNDTMKIMTKLFSLRTNSQVLVFYDGAKSSTPWTNTHYVSYKVGSFSSLARTYKIGKTFNFNGKRYKILSGSRVFSWSRTGVHLPNEIFINIKRV